MKTLKESLLADIEASMQAGDTYAKIPENTFKKFLNDLEKNGTPAK